MKIPQLALGLVSLFLFSPVRAGEPQSHFALVQNTIEQFAVPRFQNLAAQTSQLPSAADAICAAGDSAAREDMSGRFRAVVQAWAEVEFLRFGPLSAEGRRERISFWPDPRGIMTRQLRQLLAAKDMKAVEDGALAKQSAALQGLPALEALITDKEHPLGPDADSAYNCAFAKAIAANLASLTKDLSEAWTKSGGWKEKMLRPGSDNDVYKEPAEAAGEFVKALLTGLQLLGETQVKPRLDAKTVDKPESGKPHNPNAGPFEKSNLSREYFIAQSKAAHAIYDRMNLESYLPEDKDWVKTWAAGAWKTIDESNGAGGAASGQKNSERPPLREVHAKLNGLRQLISKEMASAAGLTLGFNELDGD